jgi:hypothetical protein
MACIVGQGMSFADEQKLLVWNTTDKYVFLLYVFRTQCLLGALFVASDHKEARVESTFW